MDKETIDLLQYIPTHITTWSRKQRPLNIHYDAESVILRYEVSMRLPNNGFKNQEFSCTIPRYVAKNERTFEVLGLLQAEMGKTQNGNLSFSNHECHIINRVVKWFERELQLDKPKWKWSIKVNINQPAYKEYKQLIESKVIDHWTTRTQLTKEQAYPKMVTYVSEKYTKNKKLQFYDYGTLVLEYKNNLFSQIIKNFVRKITYEQIVNEKEEHIRGYMRGIIAGEGCINDDPVSKHYTVHISATKPEEREIYKKCLEKIGIEVKVYTSYKEMLISKRHNIIRLLKQRIMTLSKSKYAKFLYMLQRYQGINEETGYFMGKIKGVWNKHPQEKIDKIIELYNSGIKGTKNIADMVGVSAIKVNRVLRENGLGKRAVPRCNEETKQKIVAYVKENPKMPNNKIAEIFDISKSTVQRIRTKFNCRRPRDLMKTPQEKVDRIIQIYKENPVAKIEEISNIVGVSDTVVRNVRKRYNLKHLGYMHLVGNNNRKYKQKEKELLNKNNLKV